MNEQYFNNNFAKVMYRETLLRKEFDTFPYIKHNCSSNCFSRQTHINDRIIGERVKYLGIEYNKKLSAVACIGNAVTIYPLGIHTTAIGFVHSGCYIAKFQLKGYWYICCIGKPSAGSGNSKTVWNRFIDLYHKKFNKIILFDPAKGHSKLYTEKDNGSKSALCGLITPDGSCHSAVINRSNFNLSAPYSIWKTTPQKSLFI